MCIICDNTIKKSFKELQKLYCYNCPLLTNIPSIQGLQTLYCYNCQLVNKIPSIQG